MDVRELILSDLETSLDPRKLELVDRWIINDTDGHISAQIENDLDKQITRTDLVNKREITSREALADFIEKYCHGMTLSYRTSNHMYKDEDTTVFIPIGDFNFDVNLSDGDKLSSILYNYDNSLGNEISVIDCYCYSKEAKSDAFSIYCSEGINIIFNSDLFSITYLNNYFDLFRKKVHCSTYEINNPPKITIADYGLSYIGNIVVKDKSDQVDSKRAMLNFDLLLFNEQKNKDFLKGYVASPFLFTSSGIFVLSEMFLPIRKTQILDEETRAVSNYLYRL